MSSSLPGQRPDHLANFLAQLAFRYPGPGGAAAIIHEGRVLATHCWGYASLEKRLAFTPSSLFRICSISKQFTCALMLALFPDPEALAPLIATYLPNLPSPLPSVHHLAHNQSGLRDYWAVAMLHGAAIEGQFSDQDARRLFQNTRSLHFTPGDAYSYVNQNFRLISDALEDATGRPFAVLLQDSLFTPIGMNRAILAADTTALPDGTTGYEGTPETGFRPAHNHIYWTGDAGIAASLDDMVAWECYIDATRHDRNGLYNRLSQPVFFADGTPASYGFGLQRTQIQNHAVTQHGGALRGWRSHRLHCADYRLSIVVLFNHMSAAQHAALEVFEECLKPGTTMPRPKDKGDKPTTESARQKDRLSGIWLEESTGLSARITRSTAQTATQQPDSSLELRYMMLPEILHQTAPDKAESSSVSLVLKDSGHLEMHRPTENRISLLTRMPDLKNSAQPIDFIGHYYCADINAECDITLKGGIFYAGFSGILGVGRMERLEAISPDIWLFPCPRALDHTAPGDWTLLFGRNGQNNMVTTLHVGCWLARNLVFTRQNPSENRTIKHKF